jgi:hypothetical protein
VDGGPGVSTATAPRTRSAPATYVYCAVQAPKAPALARAPRGLTGTGRLRALDAGDGLWLVVADAPLARYGADAIERSLHDLDWLSRRAVEHEAVVEHTARGAVTIPMKMFTLFASDERALAHIRAMRRSLARVAARVAGREEWGVRIVLDDARARRALAAQSRARTPRPRSGTAFLQQKKQAQEAVRELRRRAREDVERVFDELAQAADDARRRRPGEAEVAARLLLDAAFLVRARRVKGFRAVAARAAARLAAAGADLRLTGPWPPYNFVGDAT